MTAAIDKVWLADPAESYIPAEVIDTRIGEMAEDLAANYRDVSSLVLVSLLDGARVFADKLQAHLYELPDRPDIDVDTIRVNSYRGSASTGQFTWHSWTTRELEGRHVVVLDDILDTGATLREVCHRILGQHAVSVDPLVMLDKVDAHPPIDELGFVYKAGLRIANRFVVGCGLDYDGAYRDLPFITACYEDDEHPEGTPVHLTEPIISEVPVS